MPRTFFLLSSLSSVQTNEILTRMFASDPKQSLTFIQPIRDGINPFETDEDDEFIPPFTGPGEDSIYVEINSITPEAWFFWNQVIIQTDRPGGFGELFATPLANIESNIQAQDDEQVVGFFCVSAVKALGRKFTEDAIRVVPEED